MKSTISCVSPACANAWFAAGTASVDGPIGSTAMGRRTPSVSTPGGRWWPSPRIAERIRSALEKHHLQHPVAEPVLEGLYRTRQLYIRCKVRWKCGRHRG